MNPIPIHPLAALFPEMSKEEMADLKKSVQTFGLRHKIVLLEGKILDGRNRYKACLESKIPPVFRDYDPMIDGDLPVAFVADENLNRRNLTVGQRAAIAAEMEPYFAAAIAEEKDRAKAAKEKAKQDREAARNAEQNPDAAPQGTPTEESETSGESESQESSEGEDTPNHSAAKAAAATGVSERTVRDAKNLKQTAPEEFEKVKSGEKSLNQAKQDAKTAAETKEAAKAMGESISPYRAECADLLEAVLGEEFSDAIKNATVLKTSQELDAFMKLQASHQKEVVPFIVKGWKVADAVKFLRGEFDAGTTVAELMSYANAKGGSAEIKIGKFKIAITHE